jgi:hypothetical protein
VTIITIRPSVYSFHGGWGMVSSPFQRRERERDLDGEISGLNLTELDTVSGGYGGCAGGSPSFEVTKGMFGDGGFTGNFVQQSITARKAT